jgi:5-hydroxyisourate hydrolase-like protein (transthyretin family)
MGVDVVRCSTSGGGAGVRWRRLGGVSLVLVLFMVALTLLLAVQAPQARAADTASISGTVTNNVPTPLAGISVDAYRYDGTASYRYVSGADTIVGGTYMISALPAGTYRLKFTDYSYVYGAQYYDGKPTLALATDIVVPEAAAVTGKNAVLSLAGHVTGTVTNTAAAPLQFVTATAYRLEGSDWVYAREAETNVAGAYDLVGLTTGTYRIKFTAATGGYIQQWYNGKPTQETATDVAVTAPGVTSGINATLATAGHVTGTVKNASGGGVGSVSVTLYRRVNNQWDWLVDGYTKADGTYDIGGLPTGTYRVWFRDEAGAYVGQYYGNTTVWENAADVAVTAGATTSGIDATLAVAGHVTGTVKDTGGVAVRGIWVSAYRSSGSHWTYEGRVNVTAANGTYDLGGLPAGTYRLEFWDENGAYATQYYNNKLNLDMATDVAVTAGATTTGIDATLAAAGHVTGTVKNSAGAPIPGVTVVFYRDDGAGWDWVDSIDTSSAGTYDMGGLAAGTYRVGFEDYSDVYAWQYYTATWTLSLATDVVVTSGATTSGIDQTLMAAGHITGTVKGSSGSGLKNCLAEAYRFDGTNWQRVTDEATNADGTYDLGGLPAGTYRVRFTDETGTCLPQWYGNTASVESAKDITVSSGGTVGGKNATLVAALPRLATPSCPKSARRGVKFKVTGALKPHYAPGAKTVTVKAYRKTGSKWKLFKNFKAVDSDNRSFSKYTATVVISRTGQYRFKASTRATSQIPASTTRFSRTIKIR